ncbi:2-oxoacid:acceptor oxidoreductase subunit alpha [Candidatus Woesearchaeota archaeon]|nr:2-oxoacid:acceptor oxidoreductase subunit alpha [Candidatus Woesearchaeota archaeon]
MKTNSFVWKIGGEAGYGIMTAGIAFARCCMRAGLYVFANNEYPSLIRGGHNTYDVRVSEKPAKAPLTKIDLLVALNQDTIDRHKENLNPGAGIVYDKAEMDMSINDVKLYDVPLKAIAKECGNEKLMQNTVAMGASFALLKLPFSHFEDVIKDWFKGKKEDIIQNNIKAAKKGYDHIIENYEPNEFGCKLEPKQGPKKLLICGSEALSVGAIRAGCKLLFQYPMTPSSGVIHYMMNVSRQKDIVVVQPEDEIAAMNMTIGANFAGVRAMTATSGGGFALMAEGLGLAGLSETPVVINLAMRPGPATGLPTHSGQADLRFAMHAAQDEFPRMIMAPGDAEECFYCAMEAFNYAEKYQIPVFILTDKYLAESYESIGFPDQDKVKVDKGKLVLELPELGEKGLFKRYEFTEDGISPRSIPGIKNGLFHSAGDEHDERGFVEEDTENRTRMHAKRLKKFETLKKEVPNPTIYGDEDAEITLISWGSNKGNAMEAMEMLKKEGTNCKLMHIKYVWPFPTQSVKETLSKSKKAVLIENNATAQLGSLIKEHCFIDVEKKVLKWDGRPFHADELHEKLKKAIR